MIPSQLNRFKIEENDCWIWLGSIDKDGYGKVKYKGRMEQAHRIIYKVVFDVVMNSKLHVHHDKCKNKACVNPYHMKPLWNTEHNTVDKTKIDVELGAKIIELYKVMPVWKMTDIIGISTTTITKYLKGCGYKMYRGKQRRRLVELEKVKKQ